MVTLPGWLLRHEVVVEAYLGDSAYGPRYADPVTVRCLLDASTRLVRNGDGDEVVSSTTFRARLGTACPAKSKVTLPDGRATTVIASLPRDGGSLPVPSHLEVQLQ